MFTYNITFVVAPEFESRILDYLRNHLIPKLFNPESPAKNPELKRVVEAGGEKPDEDHALSFALSAVFENLEAAHLWNDDILLPALVDFQLKFDNNAFFFITLMEILNLR